jgi:hypothetical protein
MTTSATATKLSIVAWGAFTSGGLDVERANTDTFQLNSPDGSLFATHKATSNHQSFNRSSCLFTVNQRGTYRLSHGTDDYSGVTGWGHYTLNIIAVSGRTSSGACNSKAPPSTFQLVIRAQGPVMGRVHNDTH